MKGPGRGLRPARGIAAKRRFGLGRDGAASDIVGTILLVAITVVAGSGLTYAVTKLSPPEPGAVATIEALLLPISPDTIVFEHRGGSGLDAMNLAITVFVDGIPTTYNVGSFLAAGDPRFSIVASDGSTKGATSQLLAGDQVRFKDPALLGHEVSALLADLETGRVLVGPVKMADADTTPPTLDAAEKTGSTTILLTFSEPLDRISKDDFAISAGAITGARLIGDGTYGELTITALGPSDTPTITAIASPAGTKDLALLDLVGGAAMVAADGTAPTVTAGPTVDTSCAEEGAISWTTDEASTSAISYGASSELGRTVSSAAFVTTHELSFAAAAGQQYFYHVTSTDAAGNSVTTATGTFAMPTSVYCTAGPGFADEVLLNVIYVSQQARAVSANLGLNILNPTDDDVSVDSVTFSVSHNLGTGAANVFFRTALTTGAGSDADFSCTWSGVNSDTVTCNPTGTFTVPAGGHKQVVLGFTTSNAGAAGHGVITASAVITAPTARTITNVWNFRHDFSATSTHHFPLFGLTASGGSLAAGFGSVSGGSTNSFCFQWARTSGPSGTVRTHTTFIIPPGWSELRVPTGQTALNGNIIVGVKQPTETRSGFVEVYSTEASTVELCYSARAPSTYDLNLLEVQYEGDTINLASQLTFGVKVVA